MEERLDGHALTMAWIDDGDYFGPDRRAARGLRIMERRRSNSAHQPPSLPILLRKLQMHALGEAVNDGALLRRYCARLKVVQQIAESRGEAGVAIWLEALERKLASSAPKSGSDRFEAINKHIQSAMTGPHSRVRVQR